MATPQPQRHWSPRQSYVTGDVLNDMLNSGWAITDAERTNPQGRALLYHVSLNRGTENVDISVLDCPDVRSATRPFLGR
ncbi:MAG: hypothetical protein GYB68_13835 [Chloroflexi bacterium]|nr:hypothetical protein [Chloroflexota bacterium]